MHEGIKGEIYLGACTSAMDLKEQIKEFLMEEDFLVVDLGAFEIEEQAGCNVLAREVGEKVVEGVMYNHKDYHAEGLKVIGLLIDEDLDALSLELDKLSEIVPAKLENGRFADLKANVLLVSMDANFEELSVALKEFYAK